MFIILPLSLCSSFMLLVYTRTDTITDLCVISVVEFRFYRGMRCTGTGNRRRESRTLDTVRSYHNVLGLFGHFHNVIAIKLFYIMRLSTIEKAVFLFYLVCIFKLTSL